MYLQTVQENKDLTEHTHRSPDIFSKSVWSGLNVGELELTLSDITKLQCVKQSLFQQNLELFEELKRGV